MLPPTRRSHLNRSGNGNLLGYNRVQQNSGTHLATAGTTITVLDNDDPNNTQLSQLTMSQLSASNDSYSTTPRSYSQQSVGSGSGSGFRRASLSSGHNSSQGTSKSSSNTSVLRGYQTPSRKIKVRDSSFVPTTPVARPRSWANGAADQQPASETRWTPFRTKPSKKWNVLPSSIRRRRALFTETTNVVDPVTDVLNGANSDSESIGTSENINEARSNEECNNERNNERTPVPPPSPSNNDIKNVPSVGIGHEDDTISEPLNEKEHKDENNNEDEDEVGSVPPPSESSKDGSSETVVTKDPSDDADIPNIDEATSETKADKTPDVATDATAAALSAQLKAARESLSELHRELLAKIDAAKGAAVITIDQTATKSITSIETRQAELVQSYDEHTKGALERTKTMLHDWCSVMLPTRVESAIKDFFASTPRVAQIKNFFFSHDNGKNSSRDGSNSGDENKEKKKNKKEEEKNSNSNNKEMNNSVTVEPVVHDGTINTKDKIIRKTATTKDPSTTNNRPASAAPNHTIKKVRQTGRKASSSQQKRRAPVVPTRRSARLMTKCSNQPTRRTIKAVSEPDITKRRRVDPKPSPAPPPLKRRVKSVVATSVPEPTPLPIPLPAMTTPVGRGRKRSCFDLGPQQPSVCEIGNHSDIENDGRHDIATKYSSPKRARKDQSIPAPVLIPHTPTGTPKRLGTLKPRQLVVVPQLKRKRRSKGSSRPVLIEDPFCFL